MVADLRPKALRCRGAGLSCGTAPWGSRGTIATLREASSEAYEPALPRLDDRADELLAPEVEVADACPVDLDAALLDRAPRLARRRREAVVGEQLRQVERVAS